MKLTHVAQNAAESIHQALDSKLSKEELEKVTAIIAEAMEASVKKITRHHIECCKQHLNPKTDLAHQLQQEIKEKQEAIIANLSSLR